MAKTATVDGGPAFARPIGFNGMTEFSPSQRGMSLRDYFAAHAPSEPQLWFQPSMPPKPVARYDHDHEKCDYCEALPANFRERDDWNTEREKQRFVQWPYAWAAAMLDRRRVIQEEE